MKKNYCLLLLTLLLSVSVDAQTQWIVTKLDEKILVKFPSTPERKSAKGTISFVIKTKDSVTFIASVLDYQVITQIDSAGLAAIKDKPEFAEQLRTGILSQRKNYVLGEIKIEKWKTYTMYQILGKKDTNDNKLYINMIIIGSKMYGLSCLVPNQLVTKDNEIFLNSLELIKP